MQLDSQHDVLAAANLLHGFSVILADLGMAGAIFEFFDLAVAGKKGEQRTNLLCFFGFHHRDEECCCLRCGRVRHRYRTYFEWEKEEGIDTSYAYWMNYQEVQYRRRRCVRCGAIRSSERVAYRGIP